MEIPNGEFQIALIKYISLSISFNWSIARDKKRYIYQMVFPFLCMENILWRLFSTSILSFKVFVKVEFKFQFNSDIDREDHQAK